MELKVGDKVKILKPMNVGIGIKKGTIATVKEINYNELIVGFEDDNEITDIIIVYTVEAKVNTKKGTQTKLFNIVNGLAEKVIEKV